MTRGGPPDCLARSFIGYVSTFAAIESLHDVAIVKRRELSASTCLGNPDLRNKRICLPKRRLDSTRKLTRYRRNEPLDKRLLLEIMDRLKRLEEQVGLENTPETEDNGDDSMSISSVGSEAARAISIDKDPAQVVPSVIRDIVSRIKDEGSRSMLLSNVFCHLRQIDSCYFENNRCIKAMTSAISEIESTQSTQSTEPLGDPVIPKDLAKKIIESK
ncbi:hypothetical protein APSETT444_003252 [Aspergillus pseudonomiae]